MKLQNIINFEILKKSKVITVGKGESEDGTVRVAGI
jgi:hypothetical protein